MVEFRTGEFPWMGEYPRSPPLHQISAGLVGVRGSAATAREESASEVTSEGEGDGLGVGIAGFAGLERVELNRKGV